MAFPRSSHGVHGVLTAFPPRLYDVSMAFSRSSHGAHGVITAFPTRLYGASKAFLRRVFPWRLQGVVTAFMALAWRFYRVLWRSYDESTEKDE